MKTDVQTCMILYKFKTVIQTTKQKKKKPEDPTIMLAEYVPLVVCVISV